MTYVDGDSSSETESQEAPTAVLCNNAICVSSIARRERERVLAQHLWYGPRGKLSDLRMRNSSPAGLVDGRGMHYSLREGIVYHPS